MRVLVVEDNRNLVANLFEYFEARGHVLDAAPDGQTGLHLAITQTFDAKTKRSNRLKFTPDGKTVLVSDLSGGELVVIDATKRTERARIKVGRIPTGILVVDNHRAYVAVSGDNHIAVIDLDSLSIARTIQTGGSPDGMALIP